MIDTEIGTYYLLKKRVRTREKIGRKQTNEIRIKDERKTRKKEIKDRSNVNEGTRRNGRGGGGARRKKKLVDT